MSHLSRPLCLYLQVFPSKSIKVLHLLFGSCIRKSLLHFEFIFVPGERQDRVSCLCTVSSFPNIVSWSCFSLPMFLVDSFGSAQIGIGMWVCFWVLLFYSNSLVYRFVFCIKNFEPPITFLSCFCFPQPSGSVSSALSAWLASILILQNQVLPDSRTINTHKSINTHKWEQEFFKKN